jgi:hypothetical protein
MKIACPRQPIKSLRFIDRLGSASLSRRRFGHGAAGIGPDNLGQPNVFVHLTVHDVEASVGLNEN